MLDRDAALQDLLAKYVEMLAMRRLHRAREEDAVLVRPRMAALAARFPGALREIDDLEEGEICRRIAALEAALRGDGGVEPWMEAVWLFHRLARGALGAKRWLRGRKHVDASTEEAFAAALASLPFPGDARAWAGDLPQVAAPPGGRLTELVFERIARDMGITAGEARRLVFGVPRHERSPKPA